MFRWENRVCYSRKYFIFIDSIQFINTSLPKNSDATPVLSVYYIAILVECTMSLVTTCIVLITHHRGTERWVTPVPLWIKKIFFKKLFLPKDGSKFAAGGGGGLDRPMLDTKNGSYENAMKGLNGVKGEAELMLANQIGHHPNICNGVKEDEMKGTQQQHLLRQMFVEIKKLTARVAEKEMANELEGEWRYLSTKLDRCFFYFFVCLFMMTSVFILVPAYLQHEDLDH